MTKNWFITGTSRGLGKEFARSALRRGDHVAASARDVTSLDDLAAEFGDTLLRLELDVTDRGAAFAAVEKARSAFGRLDVVVNNAGYGLFGAVEELSDQDLRDQFDVNLFGALHVTQAALPILRSQGAGHIIQISTIGGVAAFPYLGGYHASKWALEGLTESLAQEVAQFGIHVTLIEPGSFATDWAGSSAIHSAPQTQYDALRAAGAAQLEDMPKSFVGDPASAGQALLRIVDAQQPPLRVLFGTPPTTMVRDIYQGRLEVWEQWKSVSVAAHGS